MNLVIALFLLLAMPLVSREAREDVSFMRVVIGILVILILGSMLLSIVS